MIPAPHYALCRRRGQVWTPARLFEAGEPGAWFDPSAMSTLYQDAYFTSPVTAVGQPVGGVIDARAAGGANRGPELVTNGDFSAGLTGWTAENGALLEVQPNGALRITATQATAESGAAIDIPYAVGVAFELKFKLVSTSAAGVQLYVGGQFLRGWSYVCQLTVGYLATPATHKSVVYLTAPPPMSGVDGDIIGLRLKVRRNYGGAQVGDWVEIDDISIRAIPGSVLWQVNGAPRPTLQQDGGGNYYLAFDGVDDEVRFPLRMNAMPSGIITAAAAYNGSAQLLRDDTGGAFVGRAAAGDTSAPTGVLTGGVVRVNGNAVTTCDAVASAMPSMVPAVIEQHGWDVLATGWADTRIGFVSGYGNLRRLYGLVARGAATSTDDALRLRQWMAARAGVTL